MRILCGESLPDAGDAAFGTGVTTGYLEQNARLDPSLDIYATMRLVFTPALDAMQEMDALQKQLAADPHNAELTEKIAHCTAVIDAMDAYNMDTQIKKVLNGMGFPADTWTKLAGVLSGGEQTRLRLARLLLERPDLLILDDLGTEFNSSFFLTNLYSLLNNRLGAKLPTIVTTNITDGALLEKLYTEKISSRLAAFVQIQFLGSDIRVQKAAE